MTNNTEYDLLKMFSSLRIQKELRTINGNNNIEKVIHGQKLTKQIRKKKIVSSKDMFVWNNLTQKRYETYKSFMNESEENYQEICNNIKIINYMFDNINVIKKINIIDLVHKTDSKLIKLFKKWEVVQECT